MTGGEARFLAEVPRAVNALWALDEDRLLLSLSFRHKRDGMIGLEEQNEHIAEAQRRFESWAQTP